MNNRYKNPYFWIGLLGVILTAMGISPESLTSWEILYQNFQSLIGNPAMLGCVIMAIIGVVVDPTTDGMNDNNSN